jgi:hypothetical protein
MSRLLVSFVTTLLLVARVVGDDAAGSPMGTPTQQTCRSNNDCMDQGHWCRSGQYCLNKRCHRLNNYPCQPGDFCIEKERRCVPELPCADHKECDDGLYCDGTEQCVHGKCRNDYRFFCVGCVEANKTCPHGMPVSGNNRGSSSIGTQTTAPTEAPTAAPTSNSTTVTNREELLFIGFLAAGGLAVVFLFFYLITGAARPATPNSVIFITQTVDGDGDDNDDRNNQSRARQLLSSQAYEQRIYYR